MSWAQAMKSIADVAARSRVFTDDVNVLRSAPPASWEPYEVWLTRVKQPRDRAADQFMANAKSLVRRLPD